MTEQNGKVHVPGEPDPNPSLPDSQSKNWIRQMIAIKVNQIRRKAIRRKAIRRKIVVKKKETGCVRPIVKLF